jgi:hypothetical protein
LAGIDLLTGKVQALVKDRHRSREFIEFLKLLNACGYQKLKLGRSGDEVRLGWQVT